jgi:aminopeptidase N
LFLSWKYAFTPVYNTLWKLKEAGNLLTQQTVQGLHSTFVKIPPGYISENQKMIDVLHYDLHIDLYPDQKTLKGTAGITMKLLDKNLKSIDLNFYDNMKISKVLFNGAEKDFINQQTRNPPEILCR